MRHYPKFIEITVTRADLAGTPGSILDCPVARAVLPHFPGFVATVGVTGVRLVMPSANWAHAHYSLPESVHQWIAEYDQMDQAERDLLRSFSFVMTLFRHN
jgi:hypothetical protein